MKETLIDVLIAGARQLSALRPAPHGSALIVPPAGPGSLGDAAMLGASRDELRRLGFTRVDLGLSGDWSAVEGFDNYIDMAEYFYGGVRRKLPGYVLGLGAYSHVFMVGADVIDGAYAPGSVIRRLGILAEHARQRRGARVLGSSLNETPDADCIAALAALPASVGVLARDKISYGRLTSHLTRPIGLVADLAFLLEPRPQSQEAQDTLQWIRGRRQDGDRVVALNINALVEAQAPGFAAAHRTLVFELMKRNVSFVLVPHDTRGERSDAELSAEATAGFSTQRVRQLDPREPGMIKACLMAADLIVTSRMHVAILGMGGGTPALSFGYQGKFEGLYDLLDLPRDELLLAPRTMLDAPEAVLDRVVTALDSRDRHAARLDASLPGARKLSRLNFADVA